ncbi:predicted protein [Naegleria gruberi]|uniref:Predicted protein n=1 Tax=Naegleria gruberi TaxID=5762 RepID=D2W349_NAEGR|nr:uncharacterized protein NAEGRDRAFT_82208 [Naegleria gruberi]EFC36553.1 predicted protein [Naegleria gruberi]|eukprot:XP_002669297.1 predicted protein [Naegleria gruberi strain NEG-M]
MSTNVAPEIDAAWESLKTESIKWFTFVPEKTGLIMDATGTGDWDEFLGSFGPSDVKFGIYRAVAVDDDSRRTKFVLVAWTGSQCNAMKRSKVAANKTIVTQKYSVHIDIQASEHAQLSQEEVIAKLNSSTGAHKPKSYEF